MIILNNISLEFGDQIIFDDISCNIDKSDKIGLVGRNGSGKSTLLKVISDQHGLDGGDMSIEKGMKIGYMPQEIVLNSSKNIFEETFSVFKEIDELSIECHRLEKKISKSENSSADVERYADIQHRLLEFDVDKSKLETEKILCGLGFKKEQFNDSVSELSVGWRMRIVLAKLLLQKADFYLFDEPTNHLDIVTKDWFLNFLKNSDFGFMLVCHDRYFLDHLCSKIFELEGGRGNLYHGNYSSHLNQKEERTRILKQKAAQQEKEIAQKMRTIERFRASASKSRMAQSMLKEVQKIEKIEIDSESRFLNFRFPPIKRSGRIVLKVDKVSNSFGDKKTFSNIGFEVERGEKVAIVAPNGVGKTTLFNLITGKLPLQNGTVEFGHNVKPAFFEQDQDKVLNKNNTVFDEVESSCLTSESRMLVRKFLGAFLFSGDDVYKKIGVLSGGEKNRVAMVKVLLKNANCLLLDEPTNHLDIQSKEILLNALQQFKGTILFVSHDRDFLDKLATRIFELSPDKIVSYSGNYESYLYHKSKNEMEEDSSCSVKTLDSAKRKPVAGIDHKSRKKIRNLESKIDSLEKEIKDLTSKLEFLEYGSDKFTKIYEVLQNKQKELDDKVREWELLQ